MGRHRAKAKVRELMSRVKHALRRKGTPVRSPVELPTVNAVVIPSVDVTGGTGVVSSGIPNDFVEAQVRRYNERRSGYHYVSGTGSQPPGAWYRETTEFREAVSDRVREREWRQSILGAATDAVMDKILRDQTNDKEESRRKFDL